MREHLDPDDPHHRLWLPGRKWMAQRTLSRTIPALVVREDEEALLPTPNAWLGRRPENATADPERAASRLHEGRRGKRSVELPDALAAEVTLMPTPVVSDGRGLTDGESRDGGPGLREIDKLLPTPTAGDAKAAGSRNLEGSKARPGVSLTDAIQTGDSSTPRLLPTPQAADGDGGRQEKGAMSAGGVRPSGQKATLPLPTAVSMRETISETPFAAEPGEQASLFDAGAAEGEALLPTPVANPDNPGAGGELRAAVVHGEGRRNETGVDTLGRPNAGRPSRLLPTPTASDGDKGGPNRRDGAGNAYLSGVDILFPTPTAQDAENTAGPSQRERNSDPLNVVAADLAEPQLLPTPRVTAERNSRKSMVENQQWSSIALAQAAEIASGVLPREFKSWDEVPGEIGRDARRRLLPSPATRDHHAQGAGHNEEARSSALSTVVQKTDDVEVKPADVSWGVYEAAIRRWEAVLGRDAPAPTDEKGRLDPAFVEWMLGYPAGWFDLPGLKRTAKLRALGNSVQVQCGEVVGAWARELVLSGVLFEQ